MCGDGLSGAMAATPVHVLGELRIKVAAGSSPGEVRSAIRVADEVLALVLSASGLTLEQGQACCRRAIGNDHEGLGAWTARGDGGAVADTRFNNNDDVLHKVITACVDPSTLFRARVEP